MTAENNARLEKLTALSKPYKAFLYDCDGTLADNMAAHKETYVRIAWDEGFEIDGAIVDELAGLPTVKVVEEMNRRYGTSFDPRVFSDLKDRLFLEEFVDKTRPVEYVVKHLKNHAGKVRIGVVSGGARSAVERTLKVLGIADFVELCICAGETAFGKPHPHPFLTAASYLGVSPAECLVLEDGESGVAAAKSAGMNWVRVDQIDALEPQVEAIQD